MILYICNLSLNQRREYGGVFLRGKRLRAKFRREMDLIYEAVSPRFRLDF